MATQTISRNSAKAHPEEMGTAPIVLRGLTKRFSEEVLAVDALDLTVQNGQVCGLLGPNGAGKTTVLRMLLGLIHPTSGTAEIFGRRMRSSHPVLGRVGALVEGPAFVPHLSGMKNLEFYWRAGGQDLRDSNIAEALEVAGLGSAINRKVGQYSKGMRQRLAIAQALLNKPDLLVLDEPTVGLDPEEMREIRELVRRAADRGATVLLSSHILAEVEQVCTHAAVMEAGRLLAAGSVSKLTASTSSVYLEVDNLEQATVVLNRLQGVKSIVREAPGLSLQLDGIERKEVVAALVHAGVGVETVASRHRLEDAFFQMLSGDSS